MSICFVRPSIFLPRTTRRERLLLQNFSFQVSVFLRRRCLLSSKCFTHLTGCRACAQRSRSALVSFRETAPMAIGRRSLGLESERQVSGSTWLSCASLAGNSPSLHFRTSQRRRDKDQVPRLSNKTHGTTGGISAGLRPPYRRASS